jgi:hypothetical protein
MSIKHPFLSIQSVFNFSFQAGFKNILMRLPCSKSSPANSFVYLVHAEESIDFLYNSYHWLSKEN